MSYSGNGSNFSNPYYQNQYYTGANAYVNNQGNGNVNFTQNVSSNNIAYNNPYQYTIPQSDLAKLFSPYMPGMIIQPVPYYPPQPTYYPPQPQPQPQNNGGFQNFLAMLFNLLRMILNQQHQPSADEPTEPPPVDDYPTDPVNSNTVYGTARNDSIRLTRDNNTVYTFSGNDMIRVGSNENRINAGSGNDIISMADNVDGNVIDGDRGDDLIVFTGNKTDYEITDNDDGSFTISKDGNSNIVKNVERFKFGDIEYTEDELLNTIKGDDEDNNMDVNVDNQTVNAGEGDDNVNVNSTNNTINGEEDDDTVTLNEGADNNTVNGAAGDDTVNIESDNNTINGGDGDDTVNVSDGVNGNSIDGGEGDDLVTFTGNKTDYEISENEGKLTISKDGNSTTVTNAERFRFGDIEYTRDEMLSNIKGDTGDNTIDVKVDNQTVNAGEGDDNVSVSSKSNTINGEDGDDTVTLNEGADNNTVNGGAGDDNVNVSSDSNTVNGEDGDDTVTLNESADNNTVNGGLGNDTVNISSSNNTINTDDGDDTIDMKGELGNNTVNGGVGTDTVVVTGNVSQYSMTRDTNAGTYTLTRNGQSIVMSNVENIKFADGTLTVDEAFNRINPPPPPPQTDPMVLDIDGNNQVDLTSVEDGVMFDIDGDGAKEQVAWTEAKGDKTDGWLALDRDGNGQIDSGKELFGDQHGSSNGFEELGNFDDNGDGVIDSKDSVYEDLRIWQDKNHDGISQQDELSSLKESGVESVNLNYTKSEETDQNGNALSEQGSFTRTDEKAAEIASENGTSTEDAKEGKVVDAWLNTAS